MTAGFVTVPERDAIRLRNATVPAALMTGVPPGVPVSPDGLAVVDLAIRDARIAAVLAPTRSPLADADVDLQRAQVWPCLIDMHTHLDKGHTWERAPNPDGTFAGALRTVAADRAASWSADDVRRRMDFGLRCSWAHGTRAVRTHLDSMSPQGAITWPVFEELRKQWAGRIELQAVSLAPLQVFGTAEGTEVANRVAAAGGILGAVAFVSPEIDALLDRLLDLAAERGLAVDFHCDESGDVGVGPR